MANVLDFTINMSMLMGGNFSEAASPAVQKISELQKKIQTLSNTAAQVQKFQGMKSSLTEMRDKLNAAQSRVRTLREEMRRTEQPSRKMRQEFTQANLDASKLSAAVQNQMKSIAQLGQSLKNAGVDTSHLAAEEDNLRARIDRTREAQDRLNQARTRYTQLRSRFDWGNMKGDFLSSAAAVMAFKKPITVNMDFEQAMAQVRAVSSPTQEQFLTLENQAKALGSSTQFSATQAANAQETLIRAGLNVSQVIETLPSLLSVASAEGLEIAQAADLLVNSTQGAKLDVSMMPIVGDILAYTSSHSNTNIPQLAEAMQIAAPIAADIGMSVEQLASLLGAMSTTVRGAPAGTAMASTIGRLAKAPKQVKDALRELGIATMTREGAAVEIPVIIEQLENKLASMGAMKAANYRARIYGQFAPQMSGLAANIMNGQFDTLQLGNYTERNGAAQAMSTTRNDTLKGDITSLSSAWEGLMIKIGEALTPINRFFTQTLTEGIQKLTAFMNEHKGFFDLMIQAVYAWGAFKISSTVLSYFRLGIEYLSAWKNLRTAERAAELITAANNAGTLADNMGSAAKSAGAFGLSLSSALGMLSAVAFISYEIYQHWDDIKKVAEAAGEVFKSIDRSVPASSLTPEHPDFHIRQMESIYQIPSLAPTKKNAEGGIYSRPIWTWAAEAGPEAIIPLSDKSRGIPLLMKAAQILGVQNQSQTLSQNSLTQAGSLNLSQNSLAQAGSLNLSQNSLAQAGSLTLSSNNSSVKEMADNVGLFSRIDNHYTQSAGYSPVNLAGQALNINVTVQGDSQDSESLASRIADKVREILESMNSLQERVSYA